MVAPMLSLSRPKLVTNWKSDVFLNDTYLLDRDLPHYCHTATLWIRIVLMRIRSLIRIQLKILIWIRIRGGGGGRSAKNVHPPWQNPRYAPAGTVQNIFSKNLETVKQLCW